MKSSGFVFRRLGLTTALALGLMLAVTGCKSKQDEAIEAAKKQAAATNQEQKVTSVDKNGNTVVSLVEPPVQGQSGQVVTTTVTPKGAAANPNAQLAADTSADTAAANGGAPGSANAAPGADDSSSPITPATAPIPVPPTVPAPPPQMHITAGTSLAIRINQRISAKDSNPGDRFTGQIAVPITDNGQVIIPKGAPVSGRIDNANGRGKFKGAADISLRLTDLTLNGKDYALKTHDTTRTKKGKGKRTGAFIGGGSGLGLLIGGLAGGGKGALIGGLAGAGAGTAGAGLTGNADLVIPAESIVRFRLADALVVDQSDQ